MQETFEIEAEVRTDLGKGASRRLRHANKVPAIIYGGGKDPQSLTLNHNELILHLEHEAFYSHILSVKVNGKPQKAVLRDVQRHPAKALILHIDFLRVSEKESLKMSIPLHFTNEEKCEGVKMGGGQISHLVTQVEVQCLAKDLPEYIEVDMTPLDLGESYHLSDLKLPEGVELTELAHGHDLAVVSVLKPKGGAAEEEEEAAAPEAPEGGAEEPKES
jgi:large subunit ribosomal protein L25